MLGGVFFSGPVRGSGAPIGGSHGNPLPFPEPVRGKAARALSRRDCGGSRSSASGGSSGEAGERTGGCICYGTGNVRGCMSNHAILRHADRLGRAVDWPSWLPSLKGRTRCISRTAGINEFAFSQVVATVDGCHEVEHADDALATECEPRGTAGGMYRFVLSNLDTELPCVVAIKP